jgi:hypothetical protein
MKLGSAMVERTLDQFEAEAIPQDHPAAAQLNELFGDHTFFVDDNGLNIVEPVEPAETGAWTGKVVQLAKWTDATRPSLVPHEPEATGLTVTIGSDGPDRVA